MSHHRAAKWWSVRIHLNDLEDCVYLLVMDIPNIGRRVNALGTLQFLGLI